MISELKYTSRRKSLPAFGAFGCTGLLAACLPSNGVSNGAPEVSTQGAVMQVPETLRGVLELALDVERKAQATYQAVIDRHGPVRPFINIIEAERLAAGQFPPIAGPGS